MSGMFPSSGVPPQDANNSLPDPDTVNCQELWYSTNRCSPRFDPAAANAVLSELLNIVNDSGNVYDCSKLDNVSVAIKDISQDQLFGCLSQLFPLVTNACSIEPLVLITDTAGCKKIARYSEINSRLTYIGNDNILPPGVVEARPKTPTSPTTFYTQADLLADVKANTVNEAKLSNNLLGTGTFTLSCTTRVNFAFYTNVVFAPKANNGDGCASKIICRVDNKFSYTSGGTIIPSCSTFNNFVAAHDSTSDGYSYTAGVHTVQVYIIAAGASLLPAQVPIRGAPTGTGTIVYVNVG